MNYLDSQYPINKTITFYTNNNYCYLNNSSILSTNFTLLYTGLGFFVVALMMLIYLCTKKQIVENTVHVEHVKFNIPTHIIYQKNINKN